MSQKLHEALSWEPGDIAYNMLSKKEMILEKKSLKNLNRIPPNFSIKIKYK